MQFSPSLWGLPPPDSHLWDQGYLQPRRLYWRENTCFSLCLIYDLFQVSKCIYILLNWLPRKKKLYFLSLQHTHISSLPILPRPAQFDLFLKTLPKLLKHPNVTYTTELLVICILTRGPVHEFIHGWGAASPPPSGELARGKGCRRWGRGANLGSGIHHMCHIVCIRNES